MPFEIVRNDISNMEVDAIVNASGHHPIVGSGVDTAIHKKAGPRLLFERKKYGVLNTCDVAETPAFELDARYVLHVAGPTWRGGKHGEEEMLAACYRNALNKARELGCESIAFPLLAAGNHGFPKSKALQIAINEFSKFLLEHDMHIYLVVFNRDAYQLSEKLVSSVKSYIDEKYVEDRLELEYRYNSSRMRMAYDEPREAAICSIQKLSLQNIMDELDAGFSETLLELIKRSGKKAPDVYKRANVDKKLFSKIKNNINYKPSKTTAVAFALALELDLDETQDLIGRAGYTLTHSSKFDIIIEYFIEHGNYDIFEINEVLFEFDQPLIGF